MDKIEISSDWYETTIGEFSPLQRGFDLPNRDRVDGEFPVVYSNGIVNYHNSYQVKGPGIVTGRSGTIGKVHYVEGNYWPHNTSLWVTNFNKSVPKYAYYLLKAIGLDRFSSGSGVPTLNRNDVHSFKIRVPKSKKEQTAIANALSDVDALIASIEKLIAKKQAIKTASMQQLLTGKKRLPPFDTYQETDLAVMQGDKQIGQSKGTQQTELGEIPEDWEVSPLEPLIRFSNGAAHENSISAYGKYTVVNSKFISREGTVAKYSEDCFAPTTKGNVLMVMSDIPNGKAIAKCYVVDEDNKYTVNQRICSLEPIAIDSLFLFYVLNRNKFYLKFDDGAKQTNLRRQDVLDCPLVVPSAQEQQAIAEVISNMDIDLKIMKSRLTKTQQIKQGMMQELLTGKTRLPVAEITAGEAK